jgi:multidrug resistance efflux pump
METKQNNKRKTISLVLILMVLIALVAFGAWSALKPKTTAVELSKAERGTLVQNLTIKANLEAIDTFETALGLSAKVIKIEKREGETVSAGDVLVRLDTADLQYQLDRATISLDQLKLSTENARAQAAISLDSAQLSFEQAKKNYEDVRKKYNNGTATRLMRDQAETTMKTAENQVKLAQASYDSLDMNTAGSERQRQIDAATLEIENLRRKIDESVVRSAISGVVTILEVREDQFPTQSNSKVQVMDLSKLLIKANVDQNDVVRIKTVNRRQSRSKAWPSPIRGLYPRSARSRHPARSTALSRNTRSRSSWTRHRIKIRR